MAARLFLLATLIAGCGISGGDDPGDHDADEAGGDVDTTSPDGPPTWYGDLAPMLEEHCGACHREGGLAPFTVDDYATVKAWAPAIAVAVADGTMPPFDAAETPDCPAHVPFADDRRLSDDDKATIAAWIADGTPEGDAATAPVVEPTPADVIADPDALLSIHAPYTVEGTDDHYVCFRVEVPLEQDVYLTGVQVLPDNDLVVHHVLVWSDPDDQSKARVDEKTGAYPCSGTPDFFPTQIVGTWTPGAGVMRTPEGTGTPIKKGGSLVVNIHYHPTGTSTEIDQSQIALQWTTEKPAHFATWFLVDLPFGSQMVPDPKDGDTDFLIPAGDAHHVETHVLDLGPYSDYLSLLSLQIFAVTPHMHFLGRDMLVTLKHADGDQCLVHTPTYRFDWQTTYIYDAPLDGLPTFGAGDKLEVRCTYDNSRSNPYMSKALAAAGRTEPGDVWWGEETSDEMCMAMVGFVMPPIDLDQIFQILGF